VVARTQPLLKEAILRSARSILGLLGTYWDAYHREPTALEVRTHAVGRSHGVSVGRLRLLHLSDLQCDRIGAYQERVIEEARRLAPDLVVWTGDYVQPRLAPTRRETEARFRETLVRHPIQARFGSYAVRGDVDIDWPQVVAGTEIVPLSGTSLRLDLPGGRTLRLIGLHPGTSRGNDALALSQALGDAKDGELRIIVGHNPGFVRLLPSLGRVDLALAGHTHGGPQVRFLCPPEISLLDIRY
jgi:predicted MPP superfamily phosphohydrolase